MIAFDSAVGVDVGKSAHHAVMLDRATGEVLIDRPVANEPGGIGALLADARSLRPGCIVVADQAGPAAALLRRMSLEAGMESRFITPRAMAAAIDMDGGDDKTDRSDALRIAEVACGMPRKLKPLVERNPELSALLGYDAYLRDEQHAAACRVRELLLAMCPAMERLVGRPTTAFALQVLSRWGGPAALRAAGRDGAVSELLAVKGMGPGAAARLEAVLASIEGAPGDPASERVVRAHAARLAQVVAERRELSAELGSLLAASPEAAILMSVPGVGPVTAATFLCEVGDASSFPTSSKLASYCGLRPRVRQSGGSRSTSAARCGDRRLKRVMFLAANAARMSGAESSAYYARKRAEGKCHYAALAALARRMINVMWALLRDGRAYESRGPEAA